ncbi:MAG: hypothetical protein M1816_005147 [Peltula sp. TS41687]|nr:MAG: hypothetical protein M1816_005147 [Peltula sp. TS41687]
MPVRINQEHPGSSTTPSEPKIEVILIYGVRGTDRDIFPVQQWLSALQELPIFGIHVTQYCLDFAVGMREKPQEWAQRGFDLLLYLFNKRNQASYSSLVLCCYGFAGVLLKQALSRADRELEKYRDLLDSILGIIFICTPHADDSNEGMESTLLCVLRPDIKPKKLQDKYKYLDISIIKDISVAFFNRRFKDIPILSLYPTNKPKKTRRRRDWIFKRKKDIKIFDVEHFSLKEKDEQMLGIDAEVLTRPDVFGDINAMKLLPFLRNLSATASSREYPQSRAIHQSTPNELFTESDSELVSIDYTADIDPNIAQTLRVLHTGPIIPTGSQINEINNLSDDNMALKLPCHCIDIFNDTGFWVSLSGRQDVLDSIDQVFFPPEASIRLEDKFRFGSSALKVFTLHGLEGIGKTRVAVEYVSRRMNEFQAILWVDASTEDKVYSSYRAFAKMLGLHNGANLATEPDPVIKDTVQKWLSNPIDRGSTVSWLIIMDSANDMHVVSDFWPHNGQGCLLLTSRQPALADTFLTSEVGLEPLSTEEGAEMLLNLTRKRNEPDAVLHAIQIAEFWERIPACMELANGIIRKKGLSLAEFAATQKAEKEGYLLEKPLHGVKKPTETFRVLSWLTVETLEAQNQGELELLLVLSFLDGSHVQEEILTAHPTVAVLDMFPKDVRAYLKCRRHLREASTIKHDTVTKELRLFITVQDTLLSRMKAGGRELSSGLITAASLVLSVWPRSITAEISFSQLAMGQRWVRCGQLMPHVDRMTSVYLELNDADQRKCATRGFIQLLVEAAWFQSEKANVTGCQTLVDIGLLVYQSAELTEQDSMLDVYAALHNTKGGILGRVNKPQKALEHMSLFLDAQKRLCSGAGGVASSKLAAAYSELALAHLECGETKEVLSLLEQSSAIRKSLETFNPIDLYNPLRYEGLYHAHQRDWAEAERCFLKALRDRQKQYGLDDSMGPRAGIVLYNLGDLYCLQGKWQEGYRYHCRAHQSLKVAVGETHLTTSRAEYKVARDLIEIKDAKSLLQAKEKLEHCLKAYESQIFVEAEKARTRFLLGRVMQMTGELTAHDHLERAMKERQGLIEKPDGRGLESLTIADFDTLVPFGAR